MAKGPSEEAYDFIENHYDIKLTEREKMLMHTYYGLVVIATVRDAPKERPNTGPKLMGKSPDLIVYDEVATRPFDKEDEPDGGNS